MHTACFGSSGSEATFPIPSFKRPLSVRLRFCILQARTAVLSGKGRRVLLFVIAFLLY